MNTSSNPFNHFGSNKKKPKRKHQAKNFIESLKELSSSAKKQAKDASLGIGKDAVGQVFGRNQTASPLSGELKNNQALNLKDRLQDQEKKELQKEKIKYQKQIQKERLVFHHQIEEDKLQIKALQEQLQQLAEETDNLSQEVKKATFTAPKDAGVYYENFFDRIKNLIELARKKIAESSTCLQMFNKRSQKKRSHYWAQVKKSGSKYMLSQERYMVTQVG